MNFKGKLVVLAVAMLAVPMTVLSSLPDADQDLKELFQQFVKNFSKVYSSEDERGQRFKVFKQNLAEIREHNGRPDASYRKGITPFSDITDEEFTTIYLGKYIKTGNPSSAPSRRSRFFKSAISSTTPKLPKNVDWRTEGVISPVKYQGYCGSCWAFTAVEQLESYIALATGKKPINLSIQQLISCMPNVQECGGTGGCFGATLEMAYQWMQSYGMVTEETIPYSFNSKWNKVSGECTFNASSMERVGWLRGYETLMRNDQAAVMEHLATKGPLGIVLDSSKFKDFKGDGVFDECDYDKNININHGVQLVGYGENSKDGKYWIIRNSMGKGWGDKGYMKLRRDDNPKCGIDSTPDIGIKCKADGFTEQYVCGQCGMLFAPSYPIGAMTSAHISPPRKRHPRKRHLY